MKTIKLKDIIYREDLYPRFKPDSKVIIQYSECIEELPPIEVSDTNILIDGYHRWKAFETAKKTEIPCNIIKVESEDEIKWLSIKANAKHGMQLNSDEKKSLAINYCGAKKAEEIIKLLSVTSDCFNKWTKSKRDSMEKERNEKIVSMWMACHTQEEIAENADLSQETIKEKIKKFKGINKFIDTFKLFQNKGCQTTDHWSFAKATNEVKHPGNIPPEIIKNLLYRYTEPFDIVFDPFAGGGVTIDVCQEWGRRYWVSDIAPIPARELEIRKYDISDGMPKIPELPKLIFLDPPYYKKKESSYTKESVSSLDREEYMKFFVKLAKDLYKWMKKDTYVAFLMSNYVDFKNREDSIWVSDYEFDCFRKAGFIVDRKIQCPLSSQQYRPDQVDKIKKQRDFLVVSRELIIFTKGGK